MPSDRQGYPLLNPVFIPSWWGRGFDSEQEFLLIRVFGSRVSVLADFETFANSDECFWHADRRSGGRLVSPGYFLLPLSSGYILENMEARILQIFRFLASFHK